MSKQSKRHCIISTGVRWQGPAGGRKGGRGRGGGASLTGGSQPFWSRFLTNRHRERDEVRSLLLSLKLSVLCMAGRVCGIKKKDDVARRWSSSVMSIFIFWPWLARSLGQLKFHYAALGTCFNDTLRSARFRPSLRCCQWNWRMEFRFHRWRWSSRMYTPNSIGIFRDFFEQLADRWRCHSTD